MSKSTLVWRCACCGLEIADVAGYVECDAWSEPWRPRTFDGWRAMHRDCDPDPELATYWWAIERLRTEQDLIDAADHMRGKRWWDEGEWTALLASPMVTAVQ
jgi:hypothetical protein